jgi:hypothetical protein
MKTIKVIPFIRRVGACRARAPAQGKYGVFIGSVDMGSRVIH